MCEFGLHLSFDCTILAALCRIVESSLEDGFSKLLTSYCSKAAANQRKGRTGRVGPGTVIRMYTKSMFQNFSEHDTPEILRIAPVSNCLMVLKMMTKSVCVYAPMSLCAYESMRL